MLCCVVLCCADTLVSMQAYLAVNQTGQQSLWLNTLADPRTYHILVNGRPLKLVNGTGSFNASAAGGCWMDG